MDDDYDLTRGHVTPADMAAAVSSLIARAERAEAEVARLREVLDSIAGGHPCDEDHREVARAAIADSEKEET